MYGVVKCAECECNPTACNNSRYSQGMLKCLNCKKDADSCCCLTIHMEKENRCCNDSDRQNSINLYPCRQSRNVDLINTESLPLHERNRGRIGLLSFFLYAKSLYAAALGIEILCIAAAEIGENTGLYLFGFNHVGIVIAYIMGYSLAGFTTFVTVQGRSDHSTSEQIDSCCSVLEQDSTQRFVPNLVTTFSNFASGFRRLFSIRKQTGIKMILKSSLVILITAESVCILTAETVDLIFYQYSIFFSVPLALLAGAFTVVAPVAYRRAKQSKSSAN